MSIKLYCILRSDPLKLVPYIPECLTWAIFFFGTFGGCALHAEAACSPEIRALLYVLNSHVVYLLNEYACLR